jgi:hypothetical protein
VPANRCRYLKDRTVTHTPERYPTIAPFLIGDPFNRGLSIRLFVEHAREMALRLKPTAAVGGHIPVPAVDELFRVMS